MSRITDSTSATASLRLRPSRFAETTATRSWPALRISAGPISTDRSATTASGMGADAPAGLTIRRLRSSTVARCRSSARTRISTFLSP